MSRLTPIALALLVFSTGALAAKQKPASAPASTPVAKSDEARPAKPIFDLPYLQRELDNGLKVIVVKTPQKGVVSLQIPVQTGSRNEVEAGKTGFAHFFEHMMFRGTEKVPAEQYGAMVKAAGADQNAFTSDDFTNYYTNFTPADLEKMLELEADRFQHLKYSEEQFRTEALAVKGEYLKNFSNPLEKGAERLSDLAYTVHPYKHTTMGFYADIENMPNQMEYAHQFFDRWYKPQNVSVVVVGDVDPEPTFELVKKYWGGWKRGDYKVDIPVEPPQTQAKYEHVKWDAPTLPWIMTGWHGPAFDANSVDGPALTVLGEIYFGETSKLYQKLVVKDQLVDEFGFQAPRGHDPDLFVVYARLTKPENAKAVNQAISDAMLEARSTLVDPAQLDDVKSHLKYGFARGMSSAAQIGSILARFVRYDRDVETLNRYYKSFDRVAPADLAAIANKVFTDGNRTTVSIANADTLEGANAYAAIDAAATKSPPKPAEHAAKADAAGPAKKTATEIFAERDRAKMEAANREFSAAKARASVPYVEQRSDSPLIDVSLIFRTGASYDPPGKAGIAELTASMITEGGSSKRTIEEIQKALYPLAAGFDAQVDKDAIRFSGQVHRDNFAKWLDIVFEQLVEPGFRAEDFERLKRQQLNAIRVGLRSNNDEEFAKEALYERVYGAKHPYGKLNLGHAKELESLTLADVRRFYATQIRRGRLVVGMAGGYDDQQLDSVLARTIPIQQEDHPVFVDAPAPAAPKTRSALVIHKQTSSVAVSFGVPIAVKRGDADWTALWLMRAWLGEHRNSNGRLYDRIRELRGMNYGDYAYIEYFPNGMFLMQPEPNHPRQNDLFQIWLRPLRSNNDAVFATRVALFELDRLVKNGMSEAAFESTREYLKKYVAILTASQSKQLGYAMDSQRYGTPAFVDYVRGELDKLTLDQVNAAIKKHIKLDGLQFVMISKDAKGLADALASDKPSPITYNTKKPDEVLAEDKVIEKLPLKLTKASVKVAEDTEMFE